MFTLPFLGWGVVLLSQPVLADDAPLLTSEDAVALALSSNPDLRTAEAALQRARAERARTGRPLENPTLSAQGSTDRQRLGIALSQPISITGERAALRRQAGAALSAAEARLYRTQLEVAVEARAAYVDATVRAAVVEVAQISVRNAEQLEDAARQKLEEGAASLLDLRLARLSRAKAISWYLDARAAEAQTLQELAAIVGQQVSADALEADPLRAAPQPQVGAAEQRSDVLAAQAELQAAELGIAAQRAAALAPLSVGVFVDQEDSELFVGPSLSWTLPLSARNQVGRVEAEGAMRSAAAALQATGARADVQVQTTAARYTEAESLSRALGDDLADEASEALAGVSLAYQVGHTDLLNTLLLQTEVLEGQVALIELRGQLADARLALLLATEDDVLLGGGVR